MDSTLTAQITLVLYVVAAVLIVAVQSLRCEGSAGIWFLYIVNRLYSGLCFHWRANNVCPFPSAGPAIIIANHRSPLDPLLVWVNHTLRRMPAEQNMRVIRFLTAREYCEVPGVIGWICRQAECIPTERNGKDMAATREAIRVLKEGHLLGIFPEGRINEGEGLLEASPGVAWLALTAKVPVYPVFIHGSPQGSGMVQAFYQFQPVRISYGEAIDLSNYYGQRKTNELLCEVTNLLMSSLAEVGGITTNRPDSEEAPATIPLKRESG